MMRMKIFRIIIAVLIGIGLCGMTVDIYAAEESAGEWRLTISYKNEGKAIWGAAFSIYKIAEVREDGTVLVTEEFAAYPINLAGGEEREWSQMALALEAYVLRDRVGAYDKVSTDQEGNAHFPSLEAGLYLVMGEVFERDEIIYEASPMIVQVPGENPRTRMVQEEVFVNAKSRIRPASHIPQTIPRKVVKQWADEGYAHKRPEHIEVQLLCDGMIYDTQKLSDENNWQYVWSELDSARDWKILEKECEGYTVTMVQEGELIVLTNTYQEKPDNPVSPNQPGRPGNPSERLLPKTGQLWWPVGYLTAAGLFFLVLGILI